MHIDHSKPIVYEFQNDRTLDVIVCNTHAEAWALALKCRDKCRVVARNVRDPREGDATKQGMFQDHSCFRCNDGGRPCVSGNPRDCYYPHARND